ncbi:polycystin-1-like protein 3 [Cavia porcellus]|uniref:polycystin-1-like protein 3 n=1 Tax=Cavia porcellus TaxID=10141 RepID=UPI002FDF70A7
MGNIFSNSQKTPLQCLISNLRTLKIKGTIKTKQLTFYCQEVWPTYPLIGKPWPKKGTFDPCILRNLYDFCQAGNKLLELPYVQAFLILRTRPSLIKSCAPAEILLANSTAPQTFLSCPPLFSRPPPAYHQTRSLPLPPTGPHSPPPIPDSLSSSNPSRLQIPPTVRSSPSLPSRTHNSPSSSNPSVSQLSPCVRSSPPLSPGTHISPSGSDPSVSASPQSLTSSSPENSVSPTAFSPPAHHTRSWSLCPSSRSRDCSSLHGEQSPCCNPLPRGMAPPCSGGPHGDRALPCSQALPCFGSRDRAPPCFQGLHCQQASPCGSSCELQQPPCCSAHDASLCCRQQSSSCKAHSEMPSARVSQGDWQQLCSRSTDDCSHAPTGRMAAQKPSALESPQALLPLREQAGPEGLVNIHVPFSLSDLAQITHKLGSLSVDPQNYIRQFEFITNCYDLHFKDVYNDSGPISVPEQDKHTNYNKLLKQVQEANQNPAVFLNWLSNPCALQAVPALRAVSGRLPAPPPCAVPAPPSPVCRRRRRCHLTRFRGQSEPTPACYIPALASPTGRALPERCETAAQRLCSGMVFFTIWLRSKDAFLLQFSNHLIKVIGHLIILPALFINQSLHQSPV